MVSITREICLENSFNNRVVDITSDFSQDSERDGGGGKSVARRFHDTNDETRIGVSSRMPRSRSLSRLLSNYNIIERSRVIRLEFLFFFFFKATSLFDQRNNFFLRSEKPLTLLPFEDGKR